MEYIAVTVSPDGSTVRETFRRPMELQEFYDRIKCSMIELVRFQGSLLVVDEEGLLKPDRQLNVVTSTAVGYPIYGTVVMVPEEAID